MARVLFVLFIFVFSEASISADPLIQDTKEAACQVLISTAESRNWFPSVPKGNLWCDYTSEENEYVYIMSLQNGSEFKPEQNYPHSTLLGWYGVMRRSTAILEYDVAEFRLINLTK